MNSDYYALQRDAKHLVSLKEKVDLVYIDPPFGLNKEFTMMEHDDKEKGFSDNWSSYEDFIVWYAEILELCMNTLKPNGWLYAHNNHLSNALVLSKVPFINKYYTNISWKRSHPHNNVKNGWGNIVDSILVFKKGSPYFNVEYVPLDPKYASNSFNNVDEKGSYALGPLTGEKSRVGHLFEYKGMNPRYGWRKTKDEIAKMDEAGLIHFGKNKPYKKIYAAETKGVPVQNIWTDIHMISRREGRLYPTQKPIMLLDRIIKSSCPTNGIVLDPFCGAGTTLEACMNLSRRCITSDISADAVSIAIDRCKKKNPLLQIDTVGTDIWN